MNPNRLVAYVRRDDVRSIALDSSHESGEHTPHVMRSYLAVASEHFSEQICGSDGTPIDLVDTVLPRSVDTPSAARLMRAVADAKREMRIRLGSTPAGRDAPLRLAVITTTEAGTGMEAKTAPLPLQEVDLETESDRRRVLQVLRDLERDILAS